MSRKQPRRPARTARRASRTHPNPSAGVGLWTRLDHDVLGMPAPAVYIPAQALAPSTAADWGFQSMLHRDADAPIPFAHARDRHMAADLASDTEMILLSLPAEAFATTAPLVSAVPEPLSSGRFATSHPTAWTTAAYAAQSLLLLIGPDERPALPAGSDLADLWLFHSAIAVVPLVAPQPG
ncbi:hypothetical protein SAMN05216276_10867 [Streptosporangium subroseum]|uniref:Uncharacterized protein n=1 Tax=Streptosporangium subroseum TaxID=106412 RepID=A0A239P4I9_9ACTN|nr:hypothetical protein [Streptosporangium subroseum]SNT61882.1 hypothetical protein SAMN05216276_10867 [Streptosporangium subroseum]